MGEKENEFVFSFMALIDILSPFNEITESTSLPNIFLGEGYKTVKQLL